MIAKFYAVSTVLHALRLNWTLVDGEGKADNLSFA
jgi:hypothetical protein